MTGLAQPRRLTGRAVLIMLLAFFGLVTGVNAIFIALALRSFSGVSTEGAYQRGLTWNQELAAAAAQVARGWRAEAELSTDDVGSRLVARFADAAGRPLDGLAVRAELRRPVRQGDDVTVELAQQGDGLYTAAVALPLRGQWDLRVEALADGARHVLEKRVRLP